MRAQRVDCFPPLIGPDVGVCMLGTVSPLFVVSDVLRSVAFYRDALGFEVRALIPEDYPFFAIVGRDGAQLLLKCVAPDVQPQPNPSRHPWARWDAFVETPEPCFLRGRCSLLGFFDPAHLRTVLGLLSIVPDRCVSPVPVLLLLVGDAMGRYSDAYG